MLRTVSLLSCFSLLLCASASAQITGLVNYAVSANEIDSGNISGGNIGTNAMDADFSTFYEASASGNWMGIDAGAGKSINVSQAWVTPRTDTNPGGCSPSGPCWNRNQGQAVLQSSADCSSYSTFDTLTLVPYISQLSYNVRSESTTAARCWRFYFPASGYGSLAELRLIGPYVSGIPASPIAPTFSPSGGVYVGGSVPVTVSSATTSASVAVTTDGTTPSCGGATHAVPYAFTLTVGTNTNLKAVSCQPGLSVATSLEVSSALYQNGWGGPQTWYDAANMRPASIHAGNVIQVGAQYYATGQWEPNMGSSGDDGFANDPAQDPGVWLYQSYDGYTWSGLGQILSNVVGATTYSFIQRPHIAAVPGGFVLWAQGIPGSLTTTSREACYATASTISGPWTWGSCFQPGGIAYGDDYLFSDGGTLYLYWENYVTGTMYGVQLSSAGTAIVGTPTAISNSSVDIESPVVFRRGSTYYLLTGPYTIYGADPRPIVYATSTTPLGFSITSSSASGNLFVSNPYTAAQLSSVWSIPWKTDGYVLLLDSWGTPVGTTQQVVVPITFSGTTPSAQTPSVWNQNTFATVKRFFPSSGSVIPQ